MDQDPAGKVGVPAITTWVMWCADRTQGGWRGLCWSLSRPFTVSAAFIGPSAACRHHVAERVRRPSSGRQGMDPLADGDTASEAAGPPQGPSLPSARKACFATADFSGYEKETKIAMDRLARGTQSIPNDIPSHDDGPCSEEEGFAVEEEEADGELNACELSEGTHCPPVKQAADLFHEDWDLELKEDQGNPYDADDIQGSISQEIKPWVCCVPQGDIMYDPSWHHPPPLIPHYSKMVFETGQFDDAED